MKLVVTRGWKARLRTPSILITIFVALSLLAPVASYAVDPEIRPFVQASPISAGTGPMAIAVTPDGTKAYVINHNSNSVTVINTATDAVITTITTGIGAAPSSIAMHPSGSYAYVANVTGNSISRIDTASNTASILSLSGDGFTGFTAPRFVVFSPNGQRAYVSNQTTTGRITVINTADLTQTSQFGVATVPRSLAISPDGNMLFVTHVGPNLVSFVNLNATPSPTSTTLSTGSGSEPTGLAVDSTGTTLYVALSLTNRVAVIDVATKSITRELTGFSGPQEITLNPTLPQVFVANYGNATVGIVDISTNPQSVITPSLSVGTQPWQVAFTPNGLKGYVGNRGSANVSVIKYFQVRTLAFVTTSYTLGFGSTQTVAATPSAGDGNGTIAYSAGSSTACTVNTSTGLVNVTEPTGTCTIQASITEGDAGVNVAPFQAVATATTPVTITVQAAPLEITADTQNVLVGGTVTPSYSITSGALVSPDALSGVTYTYQGTGSTSYSASTTAPTAVGTYTVTPSAATFSTGTASDYSITYNPGSLVILAQPIALTISATSQTIQSGVSPTPQFSITAGALNGTDSISGVTYTYQGLGSTSYAASTTTPTAAGTYSVTPSNALFSSGSSASYTITYAPGTLTVEAPAPAPTPTPNSLPNTGSLVGSGGLVAGAFLLFGFITLAIRRIIFNQ